MKKNLVLLAIASTLCALALEINLDGQLNEAVWSSAKKYDDLIPYSGNQAAKTIQAKTEFNVINDDENVYVGVICHEPEIDKIKKAQQPFPWGQDSLELFFSPGCRQDEFYQFVVSAGNVRWCHYYAEGGNISPDPGYAPFWESRTFIGKDFWSAEMRFPLAGFYHTRNALWKRTWLFNITRNRCVSGTQEMTWSPLVTNNQESHRYRKMDGFPMRKADDDLFIENVVAELTDFNSKEYTGTLTLDIVSGTDCKRKLTINDASHSINLISGKNSIELPCSFKEANGRRFIRLTIDDSKNIGREYPVLLEYEPLQITLTTPAYSNAFYPGQDTSKVTGKVLLKGSGKIVLTFEGHGVKKQVKTLNGKGKELEFSFNAKGIDNEGATITAESNGHRAVTQIYVPVSNGHTACWIENGYLVIDGKPTFVRMIEGIRSKGQLHFNTGEKFSKHFDSERETFGINNDIIIRMNLEPNRLMPGIEAEMKQDKEPNPALLKCIKEKIESSKNKNFVYYFFIDEPECRNISPVYLKHLYKYVKSLDLMHPVMLCSRSAKRYVDCADYITSHPYWSPYFDSEGKRLMGIPMHNIPNYFKGWQYPNKASAIVPQQFSYRNLWNRQADYPTFYEYESSVWASVAYGVTGVEAYHAHDLGDRAALYDGARFIMTSLERLDSFLLTPDKKMLPAPPKSCAALFTANKEKLLILVNLSDAPVEIIAPYKKMVEFRGDRVFNGKLKLEPYQTALFTTKKMDDGMENRKALMERINAQEKARLSNGSIFLERGFDINIAGSKTEHFGKTEWTHSKLFDGNESMLAWSSAPWNGAWLEFSFPKFTPEFKRLVIHGSNLEKLETKYWKDGEWKPLSAIAVRSDSEYKVEYICNAMLRTFKLRLELPKGSKLYELYELEAFTDGEQTTQTNKPADNKPAELPANNTLWKQTGEKILLVKNKGWNPERLKIFGNEKKQFVVRCETGVHNPSPATDCYVPVSKEYPWMVFKLAKAGNTVGTYHAWCIQGPTIGQSFQDCSPIPAIYTFNMNDKGALPGKLSYISIYSYSMELVFDEISIVKKTDCMLSCKLSSSGISVKAELLAPAEEVSVQLCHAFTPLTGTLTLKATDDSRKTWTGDFTFEAPLKHGKKLSFKPGELDLRADLLGSPIQLPVFSKIYQPYDPTIQ